MNAKTRDNLESHQVALPAVADSAGTWKDPKRYLWLMGPALPGIGLAALTGYALAPKKLKALAWTGPLAKTRAIRRNPP